MNRKEFLSTLLAVGGTTLTASTPLSYIPTPESPATPQRKKGKIDQEKVVLLSDIHICGEFKDGKPAHYPYNPICLEKCVRQILEMRPLPAHVMVFGDVAWDYGLEEDYRYAAELLRPLEEAGIQLTLGMGNHDRRAAFLKVFPQYAESTQVPGRIVSIVELPAADLVLLDSLAELPDLKPRQSTTVSGELDAEQTKWLTRFLAEHKRPVILCAHHPMNEMPVLTKLITQSSNVIGYICGHIHNWEKDAFIIRPRVPLRMITTLTLPSTFYGDIGFAVLTCRKDRILVEYSSQGFWWPQPVDNPPLQWKMRQEDLAHEQCSFALPE